MVLLLLKHDSTTLALEINLEIFDKLFPFKG